MDNKLYKFDFAIVRVDADVHQIKHYVHVPANSLEEAYAAVQSQLADGDKAWLSCVNVNE